MINLLAMALPWWAKWAALAALLAATNGWTWYQTHQAGAARLDAYRAEVAQAGRLQQARVATQVAQQQRITEGVVDGWDKTVKDLRARFEAQREAQHDQPRGGVGPGLDGRLREQPGAGGSGLRPFSAPASPADGAPADDRLADCAETTLMLVRLQEWVRQQQAIGM